jgi:hypothetical protein
MKLCEKCKRNEIPEGTRFCNECGKKFFNKIVLIIGILIFIVILILAQHKPRPNIPNPEAVTSSEWDSSVKQVVQYLKMNLKDPDSYDAIEWSPVIIYESETMSGIKYKYRVRHKYRAKNSFGGYIVENKLFYLDANGVIVDVMDYGQ